MPALVALSLLVVASTTLLLGTDGREVEVRIDAKTTCLNAPIYQTVDGTWTTKHDDGNIDHQWLTNDTLIKHPTSDTTAKLEIRGDQATLSVDGHQMRYHRLKDGEFTDMTCYISN